MLYRPEDFEPVTAEWDEGGVRAAVLRIVADVEEAYRRRPLWPPHPTRRWHRGVGAVPPCRRAGRCLGALDALAGRGHAEPKLDLPAVAVGALEAWRASPAVFPARRPAAARVLAPRRPSRRRARRLAAHRRARPGRRPAPARARDVHADEIDELMWGTAGTSLPPPRSGIAPARSAGRTRCRESAAALLARREVDGLWTQRRFKNSRNLGPVHGLVGNVQALLTTIEGEQAASLRAETNAVLARYAVREHGLCNWPPAAGDALEHRRTGKIRLQWCHGAPGIVSTTRRTSTRSCCSAAPS